MLNLSESAKGGTVCLSKAGLVVATTTSKVKIAAPNGVGVDFAINGFLYNILDSAGDNLWTLSGGIQTILYSRIYLLCLSAANVASCVAGKEVLTADVTAGLAPLNWPLPVAGTCPIGAVRINATSAAFTPGTTAIGTGNTAVYYDLFAVPDTPITS
jgi:hypothetical protein